MARQLSPDARRRMIDAARDVVLADGLDEYTVDAVAHRSGVAKSTIYRHFESAEELLFAALDQIVPHFPEIDTGSLEGDLREYVGSHLGMIENPATRQLFSAVTHRAVTDERFACLHDEFKCERHTAIRRSLQRAIARGEVDPLIDVDLATTIVEGPFIARLLVERAPFRPGEIDVVIRAIVRGLRPA